MNSEEKSGPADERVRRSKDAVLATAYEMLSESGLGGFSIDAVSRRSGVAKMTIYRHWPSRAALLLDACSRMTSPLEIPQTGALRSDVLQVAMAVADRMQSKRWSSLLPSVIDAAERDPEVAALHARQQAAMMETFRIVIERAKASGELPAEADTTAMVAMIMGPLVYRRWFSREKIEPAFVETVVDSVLRATPAG